jgi:hypothetical protein
MLVGTRKAIHTEIVVIFGIVVRVNENKARSIRVMTADCDRRAAPVFGENATAIV